LNTAMRVGKFMFMAMGAVVLIFLTAAPVINLMIGSIASAVSGATAVVFSDNLGLLLKSVLLYLGAAGLCVVLGFLVAVWVWTAFARRALRVGVFLMILILVPPFVHVQSWIYFMDKINAFLLQTAGLTQNFSGEFAVILTMAFSYLPITAGLCLMAFLSVPAEITDQCAMENAGRKAFLQVYLPLVMPALCISGLLVFLLNINDYGIASVFGVNVFSLELYSKFSANGDVYSVFFAAIPIMLLCLAMFAVLGAYLSRQHFAFSGFRGKNPFRTDGFVRALARVGFAIFALFALVPVVNLVIEAAFVKDIGTVLSGSVEEFIFSLWSSALAAVACIIPAILFAFLYERSKHKMLLLSLAALPFILPSAIGGIAMINLWNSPWLHDVYQSPFMTAIAMVGRFAFIEALVITFAMMRLDRALLDNMRLHYPGIWKTAQCLVSMLWKECLAGILIVFALAMGEFGVTLLVTPPGSQAITIKIYNYLHYGASDIVAVLCLAMLVIMLVLSMLVFLLLKGDKSHE